MTDKRDTPSLVMRMLDTYQPPGWLLAALLLGAVSVVAVLVVLIWKLI